MSYTLSTEHENSKLIYINSGDVTQSLSDDGSVFSYQLQNPILSPDTEDILVSLYSCVIPYSFYNIRENINNRIYLRNLTGNGDPNVDTTIPGGNYTISSFGKKLQSLLQACSFTSGTYVVTYDRIFMKYRFYATGISDDEVSIDTSVYSTTGPNTEMGFAINENKTISLGVAGTPLNSEFSTNCPDVNGSVHQVQIRTNLCSKGCYDSITKSFSTILGSIPIDVNFGGIIFQQPRDNQHKILISTHHIDKLTIRISDDRGRALNLNGLTFMVAIQIDNIESKRHNRITPMDRIERRIVENHHYINKKTKDLERGRPPKN